MADPGFPVGGGAWTAEVVTFRKFCMSKRKNLDPWGGVPGARPPKSANGTYLEILPISSVFNDELGPHYSFNATWIQS